MDRRKFLKNISIVGAAAPFILNGIPIKAFGINNMMNKVLPKAGNGNILVLIQLHGGNDGLNTFVPIDRYSDYYNARANVAIPYSGRRKFLTLDESLADNQQIGLHPDMLSFKEMYDSGAATIVQNVGYENTNMSHFRSRDIFFMGGDFDDRFPSGWMGRFLNYEYPDYPNNYPSVTEPDPLALELGNANSLAFHRDNGIPIGISIANPQTFYELISGVGINPPVTFPDSYYGDELEYLMQMEIKANTYAEQLRLLYDNGSNSANVIYPEKYRLHAPPQYLSNHLSEQFKILARLISGGCTTRIYVVRIGGFDTHASQVEPYDNSLGRHSALVYHLTSAVKAFYDDLRAQNREEKVVTMTFSEFGRRVYSNAGYGTDHGKAAPIMLFGPGLRGGVVGNNPDLNDLDRGNLKYVYDYRQVYTSVLQDWLGASSAALNDTYFADYEDKKLDLFGTKRNLNSSTNTDINKLYDCYPNPAGKNVTFLYYIADEANVTIKIHKTNGEYVKSIQSRVKTVKGSYSKSYDISELPSGTYIYTFEAGKIKKAKKLIVK